MTSLHSIYLANCIYKSHPKKIIQGPLVQNHIVSFSYLVHVFVNFPSLCLSYSSFFHPSSHSLPLSPSLSQSLFIVFVQKLMNKSDLISAALIFMSASVSNTAVGPSFSLADGCMRYCMYDFKAGRVFETTYEHNKQNSEHTVGNRLEKKKHFSALLVSPCSHYQRWVQVTKL